MQHMSLEHSFNTLIHPNTGNNKIFPILDSEGDKELPYFMPRLFYK